MARFESLTGQELLVARRDVGDHVEYGHIRVNQLIISDGGDGGDGGGFTYYYVDERKLVIQAPSNPDPPFGAERGVYIRGADGLNEVGNNLSSVGGNVRLYGGVGQDVDSGIFYSISGGDVGIYGGQGYLYSNHTAFQVGGDVSIQGGKGGPFLGLGRGGNVRVTGGGGGVPGSVFLLGGNAYYGGGTVYIGGGTDLFNGPPFGELILLRLPTAPGSAGSIWVDTGAGNVLKQA